MAEVNAELAKYTYDTLLSAVEANGWKCDREEENLIITYGVKGEDLHMDFKILVDAERQLVRLLSRLPFKFGKDKILEGALATSGANYALADGSFDFNVTSGEVFFRMTACYRETRIPKEPLIHLMNYAAWAVEKFNDKLLMVASGALSGEEFTKKYAQ